MNGSKNLRDVWKHIEITNEELGSVKSDVAVMKSDIKWVRETMDEIDVRIDTTNTRLWWILGTVIVLNVVAIAIRIYS